MNKWKEFSNAHKEMREYNKNISKQYQKNVERHKSLIITFVIPTILFSVAFIFFFNKDEVTFIGFQLLTVAGTFMIFMLGHHLKKYVGYYTRLIDIYGKHASKEEYLLKSKIVYGLGIFFLLMMGMLWLILNYPNYL